MLHHNMMRHIPKNTSLHQSDNHASFQLTSATTNWIKHVISYENQTDMDEIEAMQFVSLFLVDFLFAYSSIIHILGWCDTDTSTFILHITHIRLPPTAYEFTPLHLQMIPLLCSNSLTRKNLNSRSTYWIFLELQITFYQMLLKGLESLIT